MRDDIIASMAWTLWAESFVSYMEDDDASGNDPERCNPGPGGSWDPLVPEVPESCHEAARKLAESIERLNGCALNVLYKRVVEKTANTAPSMLKSITAGSKWERFAHDIAMQALGTGIGLGDDFDDEGVKIPSIEILCYRGDDGKLYADVCGSVDERFV